MDVTIDETREHKFSASVDRSCAHAAHALDHRVVTDSDDLAAMDRHGLGPRQLRVFRVNTAVNDDDIRRLDDPSLRLRHRDSAQEKRGRPKNDAKGKRLHRHLVLHITIAAAY